jgi:signal transduction histidine kinase
MKNLLLQFLLITVTVSGFGQNVDSLYNRFTEVSGNRRIAIANEIAQAVHALECTDSLFHIDNNSKPGLVDASVNELMAAYSDYVLNDQTQAVNFALNAAKLYEQVGDVRAMDLNYSNAAIFYHRMGIFEKAIDLMLKCYELQKQLNDPEALSTTLNNLGVVYCNWGNHVKAMEYFLQSVEIERTLDRPMQYARRLGNLAKETSHAGNHTEALRLIKDALVHAERIERNEKTERIAVHQTVMGKIYIELDSLPQAEECFRHAIAVFEQNNRQQMLAEALLDLGSLQVRQQRFAEAIETLKRCVAISENNNLLRVQRDASDFLYKAYKQTGFATQALAYLEQYRELNDSIFKETTQKQLSEFQIRYETTEKELQILRQQTELEAQRTGMLLVVGGLIAFGLLSVLLAYSLIIRSKRNLELAETNAVKDKFFRIISHDLKNPAIVQRDNLKLLTENAEKWELQTISGYSGNLLKSAEGLVDLLENLLNWARLQTGRKTFCQSTFDMVEVLQPDINLIKSMAEGKDITFETLMPETAFITCDDNMLTTIVRNLLTNAVKFTPKGGTVTLEIGEVGKTGEMGSPLSSQFSISVTDTGIGMSHEQTKSLFRLDRKQSRPGTASEQGSGLGLIVCNELLQKHGSQLHIESEEGRGSRFWFTV